MSGSCAYSEGISYEHYSSKDPLLSLEMDYIAGWLYSESRGSFEEYAQVIFFEPQRQDKSYKAGIVVTIQNSSKTGFSTLEAFVKDLTTRRQQLKDCAVVSNSQGKMLGEEAAIIGFAYKIPEKLHVLNAQSIPVKEKVVVFKKNDKFYTVRYTNTETEFNRFGEAFTHILDSLRLKAAA